MSDQESSSKTADSYEGIVSNADINVGSKKRATEVEGQSSTSEQEPCAEPRQMMDTRELAARPQPEFVNMIDFCMQLIEALRRTARSRTRVARIDGNLKTAPSSVGKLKRRKMREFYIYGSGITDSREVTLARSVEMYIKEKMDLSVKICTARRMGDPADKLDVIKARLLNIQDRPDVFERAKLLSRPASIQGTFVQEETQEGGRG